MRAERQQSLQVELQARHDDKRHYRRRRRQVGSGQGLGEPIGGLEASGALLAPTPRKPRGAPLPRLPLARWNRPTWEQTYLPDHPAILMYSLSLSMYEPIRPLGVAAVCPLLTEVLGAFG